MSDFAIMIVDDNESDRYVLKRLLKAAGIEAAVVEASDGRSAIDLLNDKESWQKTGATFPPALILLDINMPRMNGLEFLDEFSKIRKDQFENTSVLIITSSRDTIDT